MYDRRCRFKTNYCMRILCAMERKAANVINLQERNTLADCTKEVKETRICGWKCSSTFTTTMIQSIWKTYILPEMGHHGSLQDAGYWKRVSLYWTNIIWGNIFTRQPHI